MQLVSCIFQVTMDAVFKALADGSRRKLLDALYQSNGQTLNELCKHLDMTRQAVTKHLAVLEEASLVAVVWRGREKLHYLNPVPLREICERWIGKYERHRLSALSALKRGLEANQTGNRSGRDDARKRPPRRQASPAMPASPPRARTRAAHVPTRAVTEIE
jgi:DNA-binding transcriptional ArsR family regulator